MFHIILIFILTSYGCKPNTDTSAVKTIRNSLSNTNIAGNNVDPNQYVFGNSPKSPQSNSAYKELEQYMDNTFEPNNNSPYDQKIAPKEKTTIATSSQTLENSECMFPVPSFELIPDLDFRQGAIGFGAPRSGGRLHAGCDINVPNQTPIVAACDGEILDFYYFYLGVYALEVKHRNFTIRYGELDPNFTLPIGSKVKKGDHIGNTGLMRTPEFDASMLHFEIYSNKASGALTNSSKPYYRRSDLLDCTPHLMKWITGQ